MALINQQTNLKSLKYGSEKPYITKDINNPPSSNGIVREATSRIDDLSRISQLLVDTPGAKFVGNQSLLLQTDIGDKINKIKTGGDNKTPYNSPLSLTSDSRQSNNKGDTKTTGGAILRQAGGTVKKVAQIVGSTLAQVPVNGTGTHFVHGFRSGTYLKDNSTQSAFAKFFGAGGIEGAPYALRGATIPTSNINSNFRTGSVKGEYEDRTEYTPESNYLKTDPENTQTRASTDQKIFTDNTGEDNFRFPTNDSLSNITSSISYGKQNKELPEDQFENRDRVKEGQPINLSNRRGVPSIHGEIKDTTAEKGSLSSIPNTNNGAYIPDINKSVVGNGSISIQDFRSKDAISGSDTGTYSFNYNSNTVNKERRVGLGNQGKKVKINPNKLYTETDPDAIDRVNRLGVLDTKPSLEESRDFINLNFQVITPDFTKFLYFRAYLDTLDDSYNADWQGQKYLGRAESMYTYGGFERNVSLGFKIAASTREEMKPLYQKMNYLASTTAPTYGEGTYMRGTLARLTVGDYLYEVPAVINSVNFKWQTDYPWEISMSNPEKGIDDDMQVVPHMLDCSVDVTILHEFIPQTGLHPYITNPYGNQFGKQAWTSLPKNTTKKTDTPEAVSVDNANSRHTYSSLNGVNTRQNTF